ncbi:hypothetical protein ASPSYDRAFT_61587 [Aspergillus sydowii CBS 593.65]|uniref:Cytochrome P450 n=1 Tax=Aspergillus sydowii CBS 593.65 TaxID=1036612 RepID=A0A1L9T4G4_9EURO|nr:uncharacterized protein ASPSYDRAFT_61587 [Aspergillus sydowii CBS 593.65]OJJ54298.1 hypothetical protein ASPSYDRAFT_61587 [Aspergillus sydowii CBS 593.65]
MLSLQAMLVLCFVTYYAVFHPLARYPGPFLAKFTNLYSAYHAWKGDIHLDMYRCHQQYGNTVRYAPNRLLINTAGGVHDIYGHGAKVKKYKNYKVLAQQAPNTLTLRDKVQHGRRRRVLSQAFSKEGLKTLEPSILAQLDCFVELLRSQVGPGCKWSAPVDMAHAFSHLAFDTMTSVCFGAGFNTMRDPKYRYVMDAIEESNIRLGVLLQAQQLTRMHLDNRLFPSSVTARSQFARFIRSVLRDRLQASISGDIFSFLQQCKDPATGEALTMPELSTETATFIVAGSDTTSTTLASVSHYLASSPRSYQLVATEVRNTFASLSDIRLGARLNSCTYLRACIDEALRLSPPGGASLWREVEQGGAVIDGTFIPEGVEVGVGIYSIHHSEDCYPNAFNYEPERWSSETMEKNTPSFRPFIPFSIGARSCIGKPLALSQLMLTFARLFWLFDFRKADAGHSDDWPEGDKVGKQPQEEGQVQEYELEDHVTGTKRGPVLCFRPRDAATV